MKTVQTMRAMVVEEPGPPEVLRLITCPVAEPSPGQVRLKIAFVGMNPLDAMLRRERLAWLPVSYPFTPGVEYSGIVDAIGDGVDQSLVGTRVLSRLGFGGYAEYSIVSAANLIPIPPGMDLKTAATYRGCTATAWYALHGVAKLRPNERVLIHSAAGAIGGMAMQIAADAGARVCGLAGGPEKVAFAKSILGGREGMVIDYLSPHWIEEARSFAGPAGFDVILDGNGGPRAQDNYGLVGILGRVVFIGATSGTHGQPIPPPLLIAKSFSVCGIDLRSVEAHLGYIADPIINREVTEGRWRVPISEVVPLSEVAKLHERLEARKVKGRAVIEVHGEMS